jgi:hypothetical protein
LIKAWPCAGWRFDEICHFKKKSPKKRIVGIRSSAPVSAEAG